ncbi:MAG: hypothetical protein EOM37_03055 [Proteobacteria bacterium]|jgi:hypothetical protein|nr:hypothetical protein [Alphaproteobacteria bacterium]NCC03015.1 hypothetical protein [Pseudomonadota bacterium]
MSDNNTVVYQIKHIIKELMDDTDGLAATKIYTQEKLESGAMRICWEDYKNGTIEITTHASFPSDFDSEVALHSLNGEPSHIIRRPDGSACYEYHRDGALHGSPAVVNIDASGNRTEKDYINGKPNIVDGKRVTRHIPAQPLPGFKL